MKNTEKRRLASCHHVDIKRIDYKSIEICFHGRTSSGRYIKFSIVFGWWHWPYLVREVLAAWKHERASRLSEISEVSKTFKDES